MNNYVKTLPVTGGGLGISLLGQKWILAVVFGVTFFVALAIRYLWRPNKNIGE